MCTVGFSVFKIATHIHMQATVLSGLVKIADMSLSSGAAYGVILEIE